MAKTKILPRKLQRTGDRDKRVEAPDAPLPSPFDVRDYAGLAHDILNQLTLVVLNFDAAVSTLPADSPIRVRLTKALQSAETAAAMCRDIVRCSRQSASAFEVSKVVEAAVASVPVNNPSARVLTDINGSPGIVRGDPVQVLRIVINLLNNALQSLKSEGGVVRVVTAADMVIGQFTLEGEHVEGLAEGTYARITVEDNGVGMPAGILSRSTEPFFTTKPTGTGVGLCSVEAMVRNLQGTMLVKSEPGVGTRFSVLLPAKTAAASSNRTAA